MSPEELGRFHKGDHALFGRLVAEHSRRLLGLASGYAEDMDAAHDAVQETWIRAYERRTQLDSAGALLGWLMVICRSICLSESRRRSVRDRVPPYDPDARRDAVGPDEDLVASERRHAVADAVAQLPTRQRDTVVLRLLQDRSTEETARLLGCAEGTVKANLHHALSSLRPLLRRSVDVDVYSG